MTFAYDDVRYDKMTSELQSKDDVLRKKVLEELNLDCQMSYNIIEFLKSGIPEQLVILFSYPDDDIREYASRAFININMTSEGRKYTLMYKIVPQLCKLFDDQVEKIRQNAYLALLFCAEVRDYQDGVVGENVIEILIDKLLTEKAPEILKLTLKLLKKLLEVEEGPIRGLKTSALSRLKMHLESTHWEIRFLAAMNIGSFSFALVGKSLALRANCVLPIASLLSDECSQCRAASTRALASLT